MTGANMLSCTLSMSVDHSMGVPSESVHEMGAVSSWMCVPMRSGQQQRSQELKLKIQATIRRVADRGLASNFRHECRVFSGLRRPIDVGQVEPHAPQPAACG